MKIFRIVGLLLGLALVGSLVYHVGWTSVLDTLGWLKWGYVIVLLFPITWILFNTISWRITLPPAGTVFPLGRLARIRMAGEAFNSLLPSGYLGGEALKAKLLGDWITLREATSSVLIAKSAQSVALVFFVGLGLTIGRAPDSSLWAHPSIFISLALLSTGIAIFTGLLASGSFARVGRLLHRMTGWPWLQRQEAKLISLDESLGRFYREGKQRFLISVFWSFCAWFCGAMEVFIIFSLIGHAIEWRQAWFMGALAQLAAIVGLFSPAGVGFYEGGHFLAAKLLGLPPSLAVGVSLIRRVREMTWDGIGLGMFWMMSKEEKPLTTRD